MAEQAHEEFGLAKVIFVPCHQSPFKRATLANGQHRLRMLEIALKDQVWAEISDFEISRRSLSYSWRTAEYFLKQNPDGILYWILGADQWGAVDQWARPDYLRDCLNFIVVKRGKEKVLPRQGWKYRVMEFDHPASSTAIRKDWTSHVDDLDPGVLDYCRGHRLYL